MSTKHTHTQPRSLARLSRTAVRNMQSLGAYGITFTSFTTEIHPSFYILIPILVLALLMALLAPFCVLFARGRAFARVARFSSSRGWLGGWWRSQPSLAQHADRMARFADLLRLPGSCCQLSTKACRHPRLGNATPKRKVCRKVHTSTFYLIFDPGKKRCRESEGLWKFALLQLVSRLACLVEHLEFIGTYTATHNHTLRQLPLL